MTDYLDMLFEHTQKLQPVHAFRLEVLEALSNAMGEELPDEAYFLQDWEKARDVLIGQCKTIADKQNRQEWKQELVRAIYVAREADGWQFADADYPTKPILHRIVKAFRNREWVTVSPYANVREL